MVWSVVGFCLRSSRHFLTGIPIQKATSSHSRTSFIIAVTLLRVSVGSVWIQNNKIFDKQKNPNVRWWKNCYELPMYHMSSKKYQHLKLFNTLYHTCIYRPLQKLIGTESFRWTKITFGPFSKSCHRLHLFSNKGQNIHTISSPYESRGENYENY